MPSKPPPNTYAFDAPAPPRRPGSARGRDLDHEAAVQELVHRFYERVGEDAVLGPIFNDVARVDWDAHLPRMVSFWQSVLLTTGSYHGDPMTTHQTLAQRTPLGERELEHWLALFRETVDAHFVGPLAERAKQSAARIAAAIGRKLAAERRESDGGMHEPGE